jgi:GLPGLI family protein
MKTIISIVSLILLNSCNNIKNNTDENTSENSTEKIITINSALMADEKKKLSLNTNSMSILDDFYKMNTTANQFPKGLKVVYEESLNIPQEIIDNLPPEIKNQAIELINSPVKYNLLYDGKSASYKIDAKTSKSKSDNASTPDNSNSISLTEKSTYKNYDTNLSVIKTTINNTTYLINEQLNKKKWEITKEYKKIGKYNCKKAISKNENGAVVAYFTDEIPLSEGPSIYGDLPGLIIYLEAADRNYKAVKIEFANNIIVESFQKGIKINRKEYEKLVVQYKDKKVVEEKLEIRN